MEAPLRLRPAAEPAGEIAGYVIPSSDPERWVEELSRWAEASAKARIFVLPTSPTDLRPLAAFVTTPASVELGPRCRLYTLKADRLYIPADGRLDPDFSDAELRTQLAGDLLLLHPTLGLVGFSESEALRFADLFDPPKSVIAEWNRARPGIAIGKLRSVEPFPPPDLETLFIQEGRDIGTDSPDALPTKSDGVGGAVGKGIGAMFSAAGAGARGIERMMDAIRNFFSGGKGSKRGLSESSRRWLSEWFEKKGKQFAGLQERRNRAVEDLVELLKKNPDRGLKYALPISGAGGRGVARPGDQLTRRDVSFSLSGLFRESGPVDEWHLNYDLQRRLNEEYRRIARREADLGRYRRAAYVYAHLLGDDSAAAEVLKEGRHFQEAAVLYERRLKNLREAASCYEQAGSIEKAVDLYRGLKDYVAAGDLLERVGRTGEAKSEYEAAVRHASVEASNDLRAAELLETKLHDKERAAELLESTWPHRPQAVACAQKLFELSGRMGDDARAKSLLDRIDAATTFVPTPARAQLMLEAFETHPSASIRSDASRRAWNLLGDELSQPGAPKQSLLELLPRLAPNDKLLRRDAQFFPKARISAPRRKPGKLVREWKLPFTLSTTWSCIAAMESGCFALGLGETSGLAFLLRSDWDGNQSFWQLGVPQPTNRKSTMAVTGGQELLVLLECSRPIKELPRIELPAWPAIPVRFLSADKPFQSLGVCNDEQGRIWMLNGRHLHHYDARFQFKQSYLIDREEPWSEPPLMAGVGDNLFLADGSSLYVHRKGSGASAAFPPVHSIATTSGYTEPMVAFGLEETVAFGPADKPINQLHVAATRDVLDKPVVGFSRDGRVVASDGVGAVVYRPSGGSSRAFEFQVGMSRIHTIAPTAALDEVAMFAEDGTVRIYSLGVN
jgi:tetratricopeptide (TPR) repeat protein